MTLDELRTFIRTQLDMDEEELPNPLLDTYLDEAFLRTINQEQMWPFYEFDWDVALVPDESQIHIPETCDPVGIVSLVDATSGARLIQIGNELAEDRFGAAAPGTASNYYSIFGQFLRLWPRPMPATSRGYRLRGHRFPIPWIALGPEQSPDCDLRLHMLLAHYAIALIYAMEEDEVLEDVYMKRWQASYAAAHAAICRPRQHRPLVFNVGTPVPAGAPAPQWSNPPVAP